MICPRCNAINDEGSTFCQSCGASIEKKAAIDTKKVEGLMGKVEQSIYFRIARGFAWLILFMAVIGLAGSILYVAPSITDLVGGDSKVSHDEIVNAIAAEKTRQAFTIEEVQERIDPEQLATLDRYIYVLISILPKNMQTEYGVEKLRYEIKQSITYWKNIEDKIAVIKEAKIVAEKFLEAERSKAIEKFFEIKAQKENLIKQKKEMAKANLLSLSTIILSTISIITLVSMILVLLAIERNTRKTQ